MDGSPAIHPHFTSETADALLGRVSVRKFAEKPVTEEMIEAVLAAAFRAPTSSNVQAYSVVVVRDRETLARLAPVTGGQKHVAATPVFLAFCADLTRLGYAFDKNGKSLGEAVNTELSLVSTVDATLVGMSAYLVAESFGLRGLMIGAVRNNALATAEVLGLPKGVYCVFGMCLGWPDETPKQKPRMRHDSVIHLERYGNSTYLDGDMNASVDAYDAELAKHYQSIGKETTPDSWTQDINQKFSQKRRENLKSELSQLGFEFL